MNSCMVICHPPPPTIWHFMYAPNVCSILYSSSSIVICVASTVFGYHCCIRGYTAKYRGTSYDKRTYCKSLWIKAYAKCPKCKYMFYWSLLASCYTVVICCHVYYLIFFLRFSQSVPSLTSCQRTTVEHLPAS